MSPSKHGVNSSDRAPLTCTWVFVHQSILLQINRPANNLSNGLRKTSKRISADDKRRSQIIFCSSYRHQIPPSKPRKDFPAARISASVLTTPSLLRTTSGKQVAHTGGFTLSTLTADSIAADAPIASSASTA